MLHMRGTIFRGNYYNYQPISIDCNASVLYWISPGIIVSSVVRNIKTTLKNKAD